MIDLGCHTCTTRAEAPDCALVDSGRGCGAGGVFVASMASTQTTRSPSASAVAPKVPDGAGRGAGLRREAGAAGIRRLRTRFRSGAARGVRHGKPGGGYQTVDVQRGQVTAVSTGSITVKSDNGFTKSHAVATSTLVGAQRDGIGSVKVGDRVSVQATVSGGTATATDITDRSQVKQANPKPSRTK